MPFATDQDPLFTKETKGVCWVGGEAKELNEQGETNPSSENIVWKVFFFQFKDRGEKEVKYSRVC